MDFNIHTSTAILNKKQLINSPSALPPNKATNFSHIHVEAFTYNG